jgi:hypothetical protein
MRPRLPVELLCDIFDHLRSDRGSLANCALVCTSFVYPSRRHLFRHVILRSTNLAIFLEIIHSPPSISVVAACIISVDYYDDSKSDEPPNNPEMHVASHRWLHLLVSLKAVRLNNVRLWGAGTLLTSLENSQVTSLDLRGGRLSYSSLFRAISKSLSLRKLVLRNIGNPSISLLPPILVKPRISQPLNLEELHLQSHWKEPLLQWFIRLGYERLSQVHTLCLHNVNTTDIIASGRLIRTLGPSLRTLELAFNGPYETHGLPVTEGVFNCLSFTNPLIFVTSGLFHQHIDLRHNPHLTSVRINVAQQKRSRLRNEFIEQGCVHAVISQIASTNIRDLSFGIPIAKNGTYNGDLWYRVDSLLSSPAFSDLKQMTVYLHKHKESPELFRQHLLLCNARGILEIA